MHHVIREFLAGLFDILFPGSIFAGEFPARSCRRCAAPGVAHVRYGVMTMASGERPVLIGLRAVLVATLIGVTVSEPLLVT